MATDLGAITGGGVAGPKDLGKTTLSTSMANLSHSQMVVDKVRAEAQQAKLQADQANKASTVAKETAKGTLGSIADTALKFGQSAMHAPMDIFHSLTGGKVDEAAHPNFAGTGQQTFQGEFQSKTLPAVESGQESPLMATAKTVGGVVGGGLDVLGTEAAAKQVMNLPKQASKALGLSDFFATRKTQKATEAALKNITPAGRDLTPTEYEEMLNKGRIQPKTTTSAAKIIPNENDTRLASTYKDYLQNKDPVRNINSVLKGLSDKDAEVGDYLKSQNKFQTAYNTGELRNYIMKKVEPITDIYVPDEARLTKLKSDVVDSLVGNLKKNDLVELWQDRKGFDQLINNKLNAFGGSPTLKKEIAVNVRNAVQDFIKEKSGDEFYGEKMKEMSDLFDLRDLLDTKAVKEKGVSAMKVWARNNPAKAKALGWATAGAVPIGAFEVGKAVVD